MRALWLLLSACLLTCLGFGAESAVARPARDCQSAGLRHLQVSAPDGFAIYTRISDQAFFTGWMTCDDAQYDLPTAVHESAHLIAAETDAFPLVGGGEVARPHEVSAFFPPARIAGRFSADDLVATYLKPGKASSSSDFLYLLDEFNAYSHDLRAAVDLRELTSADQSVDHRDGLAAMMAFVAVYAQIARASEPATWSGLQQPATARTIAALWRRAEQVMASSCGIPGFGHADRAYLRQVCSADSRAALEPILGRAPVCPRACLTGDMATASIQSAMPGASQPHVQQTAEKPSALTAWLRTMLHCPSEPGDAEETGSLENAD
jgi:hypothetical protein